MEIEAIELQLWGLRRRIRTYLLLSGVGRVALSVIVFCAFTMAVDWWFDLAGPTRFLFLLVGTGLIGTAFHRFLLKPLLLPLDDENLALLVEQHFPELREGLISAVQFTRELRKQAGNTSADLIRAVLRDVQELARKLNIKDVLSTRVPTRFVAAAALGCLFAAGYAVCYPLHVRIWAERLVNPFTATRWPRKTQLEVLGVQRLAKVAKGEDLTIEIAVRKGKVSQVTVDSVHRDGAKGIRRLKRGPDGLYRALFPRLGEPMQFRARGGDDETPWYGVEVVDRPRIERIAVSVRYPDYTRKPAEALVEGQGDVTAVVGSVLQVEAATDQPVAKGQIAVEEGDSAPLQLQGPTQVSGELPLKLGYTAYRIEVETADGITNGNPLSFKLQVVPDKPPVVRLRDQEVRQEFTSVADVPLKYSVTDDFGVHSAAIKWTNGPQGEAEQGSAGEMTLPDLAEGTSSAEGVFSWEISALKLKEGDSLTFHLEARDLDDLNGPNVGRTQDYVIAIVSQASLEAKLVQKERDARRELEQLRKQQELTRNRVDDIMEAMDARSELDTKEQEGLVKAELEQRQLARDAEKLDRSIQSMLEAVENNKLQGFERLEQMREVHESLKDIAQQQMPQAAESLHAARDQGREQRPERDKLESGAKLQTAVIQRLDQLLARMGDTDEMGQLIHSARAVTNQQERINRGTKALALQMLGKDSDDLSKSEAEEIRNLARDQEKAIEAMKGLEDKIAQLADKKKAENPELSQQLTSALAESRRDQIRSEMSRIKAGIESSKLLSVVKPAQQVYEDLQKLLESLRRSKDLQDKSLDDFRKALQASLETMAQLARDQQFVHDRLGTAQQQDDAIQKVRKELDRLRKQQEQVRKESEETAQASGDAQMERSRALAGRQRDLRLDTEKASTETQALSNALKETSGLRSEKMGQAAEKLSTAKGQMQKAEKHLAENQASEAAKAQQEAEEALQEADRLAAEAQDNLKQAKKEETPRFAEKQKEFADRAAQLSDQTAETGKSEQAAKQQLEELMAKAAEQLRDSSKEMKEAQQRLEQEQNQPARSAQTKALDSLQRAFQSVAQALDKVSEDQRQQKLARLRQELEKMLLAQLEVNQTVQEAREKAGQGSPDREALLKVTAAAAKEGETIRSGESVRDGLEKENAPVFSWLLGDTLRGMGRLKAELERSELGHLTCRLALEAEEGLRRLIAMLEQEQRRPSAAQSPPAPQGQGSSPRPPQADMPLIPPVEELKMLRKLEGEVYRTTKGIELEKILFPGRRIAPWKENLLAEMANRQGELARLAKIMGRLAQQQQNPDQK